jgi:hypothetical protein
MNKHSRPLNSAADARIRTRGHTERIIATEHPAERMPSQRCATKGVAAAPGIDLGILSRTSGSCPKMIDECGFAVFSPKKGVESLKNLM